MKLIGIPGHTQTANNAPVMWINPTSITVLEPEITGGQNTWSLHVEIKLVGVPLFKANYGTFTSKEQASARWNQILDEIENT